MARQRASGAGARRPGRGCARRAALAGALLALAAGPAASAPPADAELSAREIYRRVLANRFDSFVQDATLRSADRSGRALVTRLRMHWQDFRDRDDPPGDVLSKTLVKYSHPFDIRHSGYLVIHNDGRANDQFVYFPARRKVVRVNLRSENVYGTDFSFEDILPRELQDADYRRFADSEVAGIPTYTVEATPRDFADSEYARFMVHVDKRRWVVLRARYWNRTGVEVKELRADPAAVEAFDGVQVPLRMTMTSLRTGSSTTLVVTHLEPNADIPRVTFAVQRLEAH